MGFIKTAASIDLCNNQVNNKRTINCGCELIASLNLLMQKSKPHGAIPSAEHDCKSVLLCIRRKFETLCMQFAIAFTVFIILPKKCIIHDCYMKPPCLNGKFVN
jgi:hypothetical protein